uniref:DDE Tnp4 domain-containing protein n=1 Tax=Scylla olivacea TaxID=85551 RepID=A0A0P4VXD6_SCYOL
MPRSLLPWRKLLACLHILPTSLHFPGASTMAGILALVHLQHADRADQARLPRRLVKDPQNPFAAYSEEEFVQRYRLSKECIHTLLGQVEPDLPRAKDGRGCSIPAYLQLLTAMMYFATGSFQICMADCLGMSAASVCKIVRSISTILCTLARTYIKFPEPTDIPDLASNFFNIAGMPGCIGCIDGSYINIISPGGDHAELYRSRKGRFAINVMGICDYNLVFRNIICSWPGSVHDSRVFDNSRVCHLLEEGNYSGYLLGDSGYPCRKYLLTPLLSPTTEKERKYNIAHIKT